MPQFIKKAIELRMDYVKEAKEIGNKVPIYRGCQNQACFCTGKCKEIIGWREKTLLEKISSSIRNFRK